MAKKQCNEILVPVSSRCFSRSTCLRKYVHRFISEPQHIVVDSKDNVFVTRKYGLVKIAPDGTVTDLSKQGPVIGGMDRAWHDLIIDSKDNLYAHDGKVIYKIVVSDDNIVTLTKFAGQHYSYKLEDGPLATAGFNSIGLMTIDKNDNIYLTDSADKIKDTIGTNFVTDSFNLSDPARKYEKSNRKSFSVIRKISSNGMVSTLKTPDGKFILAESDQRHGDRPARKHYFRLLQLWPFRREDRSRHRRDHASRGPTL